MQRASQATCTDQQKDKAGRWLSCEDAAPNESVRGEDTHSVSHEMVTCLHHNVLSMRSYQARHSLRRCRNVISQMAELKPGDYLNDVSRVHWRIKRWPASARVKLCF